MDKVIDKAKELSNEILNTPEVKEYVKLKELIEKDKEFDNLPLPYYQHPHHLHNQ